MSSAVVITQSQMTFLLMDNLPNMKQPRKYIRWIKAFLLLGVLSIFLCLFAKAALEVIDVQYTMNAIWNLHIVGKALVSYKQKNGFFPEASTMEELLKVLQIADADFKKSNPPLSQIKYNHTITQESPYLCIWESNKKWGVFRFMRAEYRRHELMLMWEDGSVHNTWKSLEQAIKDRESELEFQRKNWKERR